MKQKVKNLIKKNRTLFAFVAPLNMLRWKIKSMKQNCFKKVFSNVIEGTVTVKLNNIPGIYKMDVRSHILKRILIDKEYEPEIVKEIVKYIDPEKDAINIGANIGLFANLIGSKLNSDRKILAIEPTENAFNFLKFNIELNNNLSKAILYNGIATDKPGKYKINIIPGKEEYSSIGEIVMQSVKNLEHQNISVDGETIDNLVDRHKLDPKLLVIDVEGAEYQVLKGAEKTIGLFKPVIISELDDNLLIKQNSNSSMVIKYLESLNYKVTDVNSNYPGFPFNGNIIATCLR